MSLSNLAVLRLATLQMDYTAQRQTVLSQNIANSDTPGARPNDLQGFTDYLRVGGFTRMAPRATQVAHLDGRGAASGARSDELRNPYEIRPDGNEINIEEQLLKVGENAANHRIAINLFQKHFSMIRMSLGRT